jgi:ABC-type branched-subunit amino acid transport system substrate-binding protein
VTTVGRAGRNAVAVVLVVLGGCRGGATVAPRAAPGERHVAAEEPRPAPPPGLVSRGRLSDAEQDQVAARADRMSAADLTAAWPRMDTSREAAGAVALRLALLARHAGDLAGARRWLSRAGKAARAAAVARALDVDGRPARATRVAVLLPLSGRFARLGREMRLAIEIAASPTVGEGDEESAGPGPPRVELRFLDTRGEEAEAGRLVERAAAEGAAGILGPVGQAEARAAAARSIEHGLPIGLLAPSETGAAPEVGVFRLWPSAAWEAAEAARLAVALGHDNLAVLHPRDAQGSAQAEAFRRAAEESGARVVASGDYDPAARDLEPDIKRFLGLDPSTNERLRRHLARRGRKGWKSFSPDVPFDLLYVPDEHRPAALIASYLPYFNIEVRTADVMDTLSLRRKHGGRVPSVVQLLGSSGWYHASLPARGGAAVDGAIIVVPCATGDSASDSAADFTERFEAAAGRPPGPLAAQAYDAARLFLAARAAADRAGDPRSALGRALRTASLPDGACGPSQMNPSGQVDHPAALLRVDGGDFIPFEP